MRNIQLQDNDLYARLSIQFRKLSETIGSDQAERMEKQTSAISAHVDLQGSIFTRLCKDTVTQIIEHQERLPEKLAEACAKSFLERG
jgi:frataxin-like iron-binding protein CyaY